MRQEPDYSVSAPALAQVASFRALELPGHAAEEGRRQLIEKLAASGQLKAGFLLRVLQQSQIQLFELGFAHLLGIEQVRLSRVLYDGGPCLLALACHAVAIDRAVFPTVYSLSRRSRRMPHLLEASERLEAIAVFETYSRAEALALLTAV
jgi:hypothetical protein